MNDQHTFINYFLFAFLLHALALFSLRNLHYTTDFIKKGESGMNLQIIMMKEEVDSSQETSIAQEIEKRIEEKIDEQQIIIDNRKVGDQTIQTYDTWHGRVRQMIDSNKSYPLVARQRRQEGTSIVKFTVLRSGNIKDLSIKSSGYRRLDREAKRMIEASAPFPSIPKSINKNSITLTIPINFSLE